MVRNAFPVQLPIKVRQAILRHLGSHAGVIALSTSTMIREVRSQFPGLAVADHDLADEIARSAVDRGMSVYFDGNQDKP